MIAEPAIILPGRGPRASALLKRFGCACGIVSTLLFINRGFAEKESLQEQMFYAARAGDLAAVKKLLTENQELIASPAFGTRTALHVSAEQGHLEVVDLLLSNGAEVNVVGDGFSSQGWRHTPLHLAVRGNRVAVVERLLEAKADVQVRDLDGSTPLHFLSSSRFPNRLVEANGKEPELTIAKLLLARGAKIFVTNRFGATPFDLGLRQQQIKPGSTDQRPGVIDVLLSEGNLNERDRENKSALELAAQYGRIPALARLVEREVNLGAINHESLTPLQIAISSGQRKAAEWLIDNGATLDLFSAVALGRFAQAHVLAAENPIVFSGTNARGDTILHWAARHEDEDIAKWLLAQKPSLDAQNGSGETPLHIAAAQKNLVLARLLIERNVQMNLRTLDGSSALDFAAQHSDEKMVDLLLQADAEINPKNQNANLPLHSAILGKNRRIVETLLDKGAHINASDLKGQTALHVSSAQGNTELVTLLLGREADVSARNKDGKTPLDIAVAGNHAEIVEVLGRHKQSSPGYSRFEERDQNGRTLFLIAAGNGDYDMMESLLKLGADIDVQDADGNTALHNAVRSGFQWDEGLESEQASDSEPLWVRYGGNIGKFLLDRGADPKIKNSLGQTAMHMIGYRTESGEGGVPNMNAVIKLLLEHQADINAQDTEGRTPLHLAALKGGALAAEILLANGADRNAKDKLRRKPLLVAAGANWKRDERASDEIIKLLATDDASLRETDIDGNSPLHLAAKADNFHQIAVLLAQGADKTATNKFGQTPLYFAMQNHSGWSTRVLFPDGVTKDIFQAASQGDIASVKDLLEFDPHLARLTNSSGNTPLHAASRGKIREVAELFLKYPVEIDAQDFMGRTPLHAAAWADAKEIVELLTANNANPNIKDRSGRTAAELALVNPTVMARRSARKSSSGDIGFVSQFLWLLSACPK